MTTETTTLLLDIQNANIVRFLYIYLVDAYLVDSRIEMLLILINALFYIERVFLQEDDQSPEHRLEFRKEWSEPNGSTTEKVFVEILSLEENNIGWEQLITKISHNHSIAAKVRTNLVGLSEKEINAFHRAF